MEFVLPPSLSKASHRPTILTRPSFTPQMSRVPSEYHNFRKVSSKAKATSLPTHYPYNCTINL